MHHEFVSVPRTGGSWRMVARVAALVSALSLLGAGCVRVPSGSPPLAPAAPPKENTLAPPTAAETKVVNLGTVLGVHPAFVVAISLPAAWEIEVIPELEAVNFYDPAAPGATPREQSQIFLRHFRANDFLTLSTVTVHERTRTTVADRPAVMYLIEKKSGIPAFTGQPSWRSARHRVTDVRLSEASPSEFLVFGKRPDLPDVVFERVLQSVKIPSPKTISLVSPARDFVSAVTKKPFGIFITPETSPVQPERFLGYHTGADAELPAGTPVSAIADGRVLRSGRAPGYGGLVVIEHTIAGRRVVSISGHLDPASLAAAGNAVARGQRIGEVGDAFSSETDGERAHLHFGISVGADVNIAGYVSSPEELASWVDPTTFF